MKNHVYNKGFTLVEMAVVLMVIGILIGGIIKGSQLINNTQMKMVITDLGGFDSAIKQFKSVYNYYPGDFPSATARIRGCNGANNCRDGNGNNIMGAPESQAIVDQTGNAMPQGETSQAWKHMVLADMISGVDGAANPSNPLTGSTHPECPLGGAYSIYHRQGVHGISIKGCPNSSTCNIGVVEVNRVQELDLLMDGAANPRFGQIIGQFGGCDYAGETYDLDGGPCYVLYQLSY